MKLFPANAAPRRLVKVVPAALGVDAPLVGAAELAIEALLADPAAWLHHPSASRSRARAGGASPNLFRSAAGAASGTGTGIGAGLGFSDASGAVS